MMTRREYGSLEIPIRICETHGLQRHSEPATASIPLPRGVLGEGCLLSLRVAGGNPVPVQQRVISQWPDRSAKWVLLDFAATVAANSQTTLLAQVGQAESARQEPPMHISETATTVEVRGSGYRFEFQRSGHETLAQVAKGGQPLLGTNGLRLKLVDAAGGLFFSSIDDLKIDTAGPLRTELTATGHFDGASGRTPLRLELQMTVCAGQAALLVDVDVCNPRAAKHRNNHWDLGDPGSFCIRELSMQIEPAVMPKTIAWSATTAGTWEELEATEICLYQDSSGGDNWDSSNHIAAGGMPSVGFRGYKVFGLSDDKVLDEGDRAQPGLIAKSDQIAIGVAIDKFWQNFPKSLAWSDGAVRAGLFPANGQLPVELQGGERKRQRVALYFDASTNAERIERLHRPLEISVDPEWVAASRAVQYLVPGEAAVATQYDNYLNSIINGPHSFVGKRELIDEYGWRNFGDLYADHEAVRSAADRPLVSHYNNQYDFLLAAGLHFLRTGDDRWGQLMRDAARHVVDIDIYHTEEDRAAYNGGMFWHTDHYMDAATATHRTYSSANAGGGDYGGGPSNEHNYTSGLLLYYFLTGDTSAKSAVCKLADWVIAMDDGACTVFSLFDGSDTGKASSTVSPGYQKPGRGAGNSINALLDAYTLTGRRSYVTKAEQLLCRCIHPHDDIAALGLDEPEYRWSYLVFLQVVGKYLDFKHELGETDYFFYYARDSLRHYAQSMLENEKPYKDVLHKVELPTETWPAQDIRKCHIMHLAATCSTGALQEAFSTKAGFFFERCITDLLDFETAYLTRPRVILAVYGHVHRFFTEHGYDSSAGAALRARHGYKFGTPQPFVPQHAMVKAGIRKRSRLLRSELSRLLRDRLGKVARVLRGRGKGAG